MRAWILLVSILALGVNGYSQVIRLAEKTEVSRDLVVLSDIAHLETGLEDLSEVPLGNSPYPGHYRWLKKEEVVRSLRSWGADLESLHIQMGDQVLITRASQTVPRGLLEAEITRFLKAHLPGVELTIQQMDVPGAAVLPRGDITVGVTLGGPLTNLDKIHLRLDLAVDGKHEKSQWARAAVKAMSPAATLVQTVPYGHPIRRSDLELRIRELSRIDDHFSTIEEAVGNVTKRKLAGGELLRRRDLKRPILVERGDEVTLLARGKTFVIRTTGRARDSGSMGDPIQIENVHSKKIVQGRIVGQRQVQISLAEGGR